MICILCMNKMCVCVLLVHVHTCVCVCVRCPCRWPFPTWARRCRRCSGILSESPYPSHPIRVTLSEPPYPSHPIRVNPSEYPIRIDLSESPYPSHAVHPVRPTRFQVTRRRRGWRGGVGGGGRALHCVASFSWWLDCALSESPYPSHPIRVILSESSYPSHPI